MRKLFALGSAGAVALAFALAAPSSEAVAADAYLKIKDIPGDSRAPGHENQIEVLSWSWGSTGRESPTLQSTRKRQYEPIVIRKAVDQASAALMRASQTHQPFPEITFYFRKAGSPQEEYMKIELENVLVTSVSAGGGGGGGSVPTENVTFNFTKMTQEFQPTDKQKDEKGETGYKVKDDDGR